MFNAVYHLILGDFDAYSSAAKKSIAHKLARVFFFFSSFFLMIIMMNLLIAILSDSYARITATKDS